MYLYMYMYMHVWWFQANHDVVTVAQYVEWVAIHWRVGSLIPPPS